MASLRTLWMERWLRGEMGEGLGVGGGWDVCLSHLLAQLTHSAKHSAAIKSLWSSGDPWALQEINGVGEGKMGPNSSPLLAELDWKKGLELRSCPGPMLWWFSGPLTTAGCLGKAWVWMPAGWS